ncbi:glycosyltransferase family 2 protein [Herbiconiux sp. CPCC 203407]|uniref:Glycosyltransferase family 2 protein n=1 Tax=Herbiconiux oxytropis TaxID=2970915 RepID=A0AA42BTW2_9MICO|nr:glycosyltransferase family 2 protein [Herbiconiux oxytropis]MCS5722018.1 glycosyltransferase family 2 protein [Herbiconiux oxytropis]MCS5725601.1 glycosyltransferase family 2 protein [Herbiconiux oxytropis]
MSDTTPELFHDDVFGHAYGLLKAHSRPTTGKADRAEAPAEAVHLDIGDAGAVMADSIQGELGLHYVALVGSEESAAALRSRGLEAHVGQLHGREADTELLHALVGDRRVHSISMIDNLSQSANPTGVLASVRSLMVEHQCELVLSVPNVTHWNVGFKLAFGLWDYTHEGLLDDSHFTFFSRSNLLKTLTVSGLRTFDAADVLREYSDQGFPEQHPALARGTELNAFLRQLRRQSGPDDTVNQFVWMCTASEPNPGTLTVATTEPERPFLSVVMRTQGTRIASMREAFLSLAGQDDTDFEVVVVGHRLGQTELKDVERAIEDNPAWLRDRVRLLKVDHGNRVIPLNLGFAASTGKYIAILDDDDVPFANWVSTFASLARDRPGAIARAVAVRQDIVSVSVLGRPGVRTEGPPERMFPGTFDFLEHLSYNSTPPVSVAFPRGPFHDLKIRFDETLETTEDWDYLMRVAAITGVASSPLVTSIYHWWKTGQSSRTDHSQEAWDKNHAAILRKLDETTMLLPYGVAKDVREWLSDRRSQQQRDLERDLRLMQHEQDTGQLQQERDRMLKLQRVTEILDSTSWRAAGVLRLPARLLRRGRSIKASTYLGATSGELDRVIHDLETSRSWTLTSVLRRRS